MRYNETKGHLPFMKAKAHRSNVEQLSHSPEGSGIFEKNGISKDAEKPTEAVQAVPARKTISE
jgi:hypothetical protein